MSEIIESVLVYPASSADFERIAIDIHHREPPFPVTIDSGFPPNQIGEATNWKLEGSKGIYCDLAFHENVGVCCKRNDRLGLDCYDFVIDGEMKQNYRMLLAWANHPPEYENWFHLNFSAVE